jgi:CBS domain-containing protein
MSSGDVMPPGSVGRFSATDLQNLRVRDVMRADFVTVTADDSLLEALRIMQLARLRHLLVERDGYLVGVLTYRDLQDRTLGQLRSRQRAPVEQLLREVGVREAMMDSPFVISPDATAREAARRMCNLRVGCLPVCEEGANGPQLVGILTESDLLRAAYDHR